MNLSKLAWGTCGLILMALPVGAQESGAGALDSARSTLSRWVETQQIISRERQDWQQGKEVLQQRVTLLESEISSMREKIAEAQQAINEVAGKQSEMVREDRELQQASKSLNAVVSRIEGKMGGLVAQLPTPIADRIAPLTRRLPQPGKEDEQTVSQRFQNIIGILNEINKFNRNITVVNEIRELADGSKKEVQTLYLGLAQAYYVTPDNSAAGVGRPGQQGWVWESADPMAEQIGQAIAVFKNESVPAYVPLPVTVQ